MRKGLFVFGVAFAAAAFAATLDELNVARDPENLDNVIYGTTVNDLTFRAGPGKHFPALGTVPAGTEVPVLGWITQYLRKTEFWIRTEYEGKRGWLRGHYDGERLIERDGGPLFPMKVKAAELLFTTDLRGSDYPEGETWLEEGDELEFASLWSESWLEADAYKIDFWVQHDGVWGHLRAYATEGCVQDYYKTFVIGYPGSRPAGWFVEFPPEFLALNFDYNYDNPGFEFVEGSDYPGYYLGPGFEFAGAEETFLHTSILFVDGPWALVNAYNDWAWVYLGTEEEPNVQMTARLAEGDCPVPDTVDPRAVEAGLGVSLSRDYWPSTPGIHITLHAPYFCDFKEEGRVDGVDFYQPPGSEAPVFSTPAGEGVEDWWHETYLYEYELTVPESVALGAPFRAVAHMHYEGAQNFEMEFLCNQ
jgi:hypothetical protein